MKINISSRMDNMKLWQDVQHQLTVTAQRVEGQTVQCVEDVAIEITIFIPHFLHHILRQQAVREVVVVVGRLKQKRGGFRGATILYTPAEIRTLTPGVKMLKSVRMLESKGVTV